MKTIIKKIKSMNCLRIIIGASIVFCIITGVIGYEKVSVGYGMGITMLYALSSMFKDLKELGNAWKE